MNGTVRALLIKPQKGAKSVLKDSVQATLAGFDGDYHAGVSKRRQIMLLSGAVVDEFNLNPGDIYENVIVDGFDVMQLREGQQVRLGDALVAVTVPCEPCHRMNRVRPGLQDALADRRGMFVKVLEAGTVRVGDPVCEESVVENSRR
jgi:MOSC domain-containing protein YiiM